MKVLVKEKLSPHKYKTPEGYLICLDAILARTGKQDYRKNEVFADSDDDSIVQIDRREADVFNASTLASFENKPITIEHPSENVTPENYKYLSVGYARNIRRGEFEGKPVMIGDLVITDADAIKDVEEGKLPELSCGYDCDIRDDDGFYQSNIRGNHVALCEQGRAGIAKIVDSVNDGIYKVKEASDGFVIVDANEWYKKKLNAHVMQFNKRLSSAISTCESMKRNDHKDYVVIDCNNKVYTVVDSVKDSNDDHIDALIADEEEAIEGYKKAMASTAEENKAIYAHIIEEELEHIEQLKALKELKLKDSEDKTKDCDVGDKDMEDVNKYAYKLTKTKNDYDEYVIKCYKNGKYDEEGTYYTDDWDDAVGTLREIAKRNNLKITQSGNRFVADSEVKDAKASIKAVANEIWQHCIDERLSAKEILTMIKRQDSAIWDKLVRHGHSSIFRNPYEADDYCKKNKAQLFKEINRLFEDEAERIFDEDELDKIGFYDSTDSKIKDAAKLSNIAKIAKIVKSIKK